MKGRGKKGRGKKGKGKNTKNQNEDDDEFDDLDDEMVIDGKQKGSSNSTTNSYVNDDEKKVKREKLRPHEKGDDFEVQIVFIYFRLLIFQVKLNIL